MDKQFSLAIIGSVCSFIAAISGIKLGINIEDGRNNEFTETVVNTVQSDDILQNSFTVKDMTDDDKPDLILYKKDGSKVVIDIANQKILEKQRP